MREGLCFSVKMLIAAGDKTVLCDTVFCGEKTLFKNAFYLCTER